VTRSDGVTLENDIGGNVKRVYGLLVIQWLDYLKYLRSNYPFLS